MVVGMGISPAASQDLYAGLVMDFGTVVVDSGGPTVEGDLHGLVGLAGVRIDSGSMFFFGAEGEFLLVPDSSATIGDVDSQSRLRAYAGVDLSGFSVFASLGATNVGVGATDYRGSSAGVGADFPISGSTVFRIEAIRDQLEDDGTGDDWENTTLRAGAVINF